MQIFSNSIKKMFLLAGFFSIPFLQSCFDENPKEKEKVQKECDSMKSLDGLSFFLSGFNLSEVDTILVKEISSGSRSDTLTYVVRPEIFNKKRSMTYLNATLEKEILIADKYLIIIRGVSPHVLKNLKIGTMAQSDMFTAHYRCGLVGYELDGQVFNDGGITIEK